MSDNPLTFSNLAPLDLRVLTLGAWSEDWPLKPAQSFIRKRWFIAGKAPLKGRFMSALLLRLSQSGYANLKVFRATTEVGTIFLQMNGVYPPCLTDLPPDSSTSTLRLLLRIQHPLYAGMDISVDVVGQDLVIGLNRYLVNGPLTPPEKYRISVKEPLKAFGLLFWTGGLMGALFGLVVAVTVCMPVPDEVLFTCLFAGVIAGLFGAYLLVVVWLNPGIQRRNQHLQKEAAEALVKDGTFPFSEMTNHEPQWDWQQGKTQRANLFVSLCQQILVTLDELDVAPESVKEDTA